MVNDVEVTIKISLKEVFEMILYEDFSKKGADITSGGLTCCSADMLLFSRNFFWMRRINSGAPSTCSQIVLSSSVCQLKCSVPVCLDLKMS